MERNYGWHRQKTDKRDIPFSAAKPIYSPCPKSDLEGELPACWDQLETSDCISHGIDSGLWVAQVRAGLKPIMPSRLFNYWNFRDIEGDTSKDEGGEIRDGIKAVNLYGFPDESLWPFTPSKSLFTKPPQSVYDAAVPNKIHLYASVNLTDENAIKVALCHGLPVAVGFDVPRYFESSQMEKTGIMRLADFDRIIGGHCVSIIGHDDSKRLFKLRNSWGTDWAPFKGNFFCDYNAVTSNYFSDGWVIRLK